MSTKLHKASTEMLFLFLRLMEGELERYVHDSGDQLSNDMLAHLNQIYSDIRETLECHETETERRQTIGHDRE